MDYFPLFCQLKNRDVLLVGGGEVALRKARLFIEANAKLTVVSPTLKSELADLVAENHSVWIQGLFDESQLTNKWLVIAATADTEINKKVYEAASEKQIFCNAVDDQTNSSFIVPAIVDRSPIVVAISSGGNAPVLARLLREKIEAILPNYLAELASFAGSLRSQVKERISSMTKRRRFWEALLASDRLGRLLQKRARLSDLAIEQEEEDQEIDHWVENLFHTQIHSQKQGEAILVGAGPGDPGLLTLHALRYIQLADVIVYDRLVSDDVMKLVRRDAERIFVGKKAGNHCVPQEQINTLLVKYAQKGLRVVRLKGGDPYIFGRGAEEAEELRAHQIPVQVIPGITSASGCSAYTGIPLTYREYAQSVSFITAHNKEGLTEIDWPSKIGIKQTLVFYMGLSRAELIKDQLLEKGYPPDMSVAIIEKGTTPEQRVFIGDVAHLDEIATQANSPALILVGQVVSLYKNNPNGD